MMVILASILAVISILFIIYLDYEKFCKEEVAESNKNKELELLRGLANVVNSYVDLKPEHPLYHSIRRDVKYYLNKLKDK